MAFDGVFLHTVVSQLNEAVDCFVDKIYQPSRDELVILLRKKGFVKRLFISARASGARIQFTDKKYENPETPPMFCMLMRKIFSPSRLVSVRQLGLERVVELTFDTSNEMGDRISPKIICEFIGNSSNIVLVGEDGKIYDAVHRSDIEKATRIIQPGAVYEYPLSQGKLNILAVSAEDICKSVLSSGEKALSAALLGSLEGMSPLVCREIAYRAYGEDILTSSLKDLSVLKEQLDNLKKNILSCTEPVILYKEDGTPADYCYTDINQYGALYTKRKFDDVSSLLDSFYFEREQVARINRQSADITRLVNTLIARARKRMLNRMGELENAKSREQLRISGELIKANIHTIPAGSTLARVQNFYDENLETVEISLDPALNAAANAAKYFKEYKKSCGAAQSLSSLVEDDQREIVYLESVAESIERCKTSADIAEIREELTLGGYIKRNTIKNRKKRVEPAFAEYKSAEGFRILVGKNNMQNDYITTRIAAKNDMWFHTKNIHGSHVVVMCGGKELSDETVVMAARLAVKNSKASRSSNVPVDYTPVKYVKKPAGAKAGMVIYTTNKTVFVTAGEDKI